MNKIVLIIFVLVFYNSPIMAEENNQELFIMYEADQYERSKQQFTYYNDKNRLQRVKEIIEEKGLKTSEDYYHAAMIFQHGSTSQDYKMAHILAKKSVEITPNNKKAAWLSCAAEDRHLLSVGQAQIWGTQYVSSGEDGEWSYQLPYDQTIKSDKERDNMGILTLAEIQKLMALRNSGK